MALKLERQRSKDTACRQLIFERRTLREELRQFRLLFAERLGFAPYCIFDNKTLDDIVARMPVNERELLKCRGMGPKRCPQCSSTVLQVIELYRTYKRQNPTTDNIEVSTARMKQDENATEEHDHDDDKFQV